MAAALRYSAATRCDVGRVELGDPIAGDEEQAPVALRLPLGQLDGETLVVGHREGEGLDLVRLVAVQLLVGDLVLGIAQTIMIIFLAHRPDRLVERDLGEDEDHAGLGQRVGLGGDRGRHAGRDQRLVQAPRGLGGEDVGQGVDRDEILVWAGDHVVAEADDLHVAGAAQGDLALAVLDRLDGVAVGELAGRARDRAELLVDLGERLVGIDLPGYTHG